MRVTFRGVRGSVPWSHRDGIVHGCNTPCIELEDSRSGACLILDAGSGLVGLTPSASSNPHGVSILLTHYHWDHVLGLPFLKALHEPERAVTIHAPRLPSFDATWLHTIFRSAFFPVPYEELASKPRVEAARPGAMDVPHFPVTAVRLNHPGGSLAYRVEGADGAFVYATDHALGDPAFDEPLADLAKGVSALVLDSHFTPDERPRHAGWGHSDWRQCAEFAARHGVRRLYLFHHKPGRTDLALEEMCADARRVFASTETAREAMTFDV